MASETKLGDKEPSIRNAFRGRAEGLRLGNVVAVFQVREVVHRGRLQFLHRDQRTGIDILGFRRVGLSDGLHGC